MTVEQLIALVRRHLASAEQTTTPAFTEYGEGLLTGRILALQALLDEIEEQA